MKKILNIFIFSLLIIASSCEDIDKLDASSIDFGAVLTTVEIVSSDIDKGDPASSQISVTVQFEDFINNDSMESVDVYVEFIDTTPVNNAVVTIPEAFFKTISASEFSINPDSSLLTTTITVSGADALSATGVNPSILDGGDLFVVRFVLKLNDGREFTSTNVGEDVAVTSHNSPFRYAGVIKCLTPEFDFSGTWDVISNGTNTDGIPPAVNHPAVVTITSSGNSGLDYDLDDAVAGVYELWYCPPYGYCFTTPGTISEVCGTKILGSITDAWGQTYGIKGSITDGDNFEYEYENAWGDIVTSVFTRQ
jgi:hypothetical protein